MGSIFHTIIRFQPIRKCKKSRTACYWIVNDDEERAIIFSGEECREEQENSNYTWNIILLEIYEVGENMYNF